MALTIGACSGGGSPTPAPTSTPVNQPPVFSSAASASVVENTAAAFYSAVASDPQGLAITYSITGGADAAAFAISGNQLAFVAAPNYDLSGDTDGNNVYLVQLRASDGLMSSTLDLQVTVTNSKEGIAVKRVATGFVDPVAIAAIPGDTHLFVAERGGKIYSLDPATGVKTLFQTLSVSTDGDRGLRALAVSPDYATTGRYFVLYSGASGHVVLDGCRRSGTFGSPECGSPGVVGGEAHARTDDYGAFMGYGSDGKLYVATGDAGGSQDPDGSAQRDSSILGKLLRVDNNPDPYAGASPRFFIVTTIAKGFHNPRGGGFYNGNLLLGDRGATAKEEVDLVSLSGSGNYGWPAMEGTTTLSTPVPAGANGPVIEYPHVAGGGITGGFVYRGQVTSLQNHYVFADQGGTIYSLQAASIVAGQTLGPSKLERRTLDFAADAGAIDTPVAFGEDNAGELYIVDSDGEIFRVTTG
ncbi:MAG: PQQ-dependent sugar dehydrogenase [Sphingomonas sp.]